MWRKRDHGREGEKVRKIQIQKATVAIIPVTTRAAKKNEIIQTIRLFFWTGAHGQ